MKYIFIPIYRVLLTFYMLFGGLITIIAYLFVMLYHFRLPTNFDNSDFWYPIEDGYDIWRRIDPKNAPEEKYYKTPLDALLKRKKTEFQ